MKHFSDFKTQFLGFHDLMKFRVTEILLVSTPYDGFVLEEDGRLSEQLYNQFADLNIPFIPRIRRVSSPQEAFEALKKKVPHLIIIMSSISDMSTFEFEKKLKELHPRIPLVMLSYERLSAGMIAQVRENAYIDRIFHWSGDSKILLAIIKSMEDRHNVEADSRQGVQAILVVDDSPVYYSQFLPMMYTEILTQTRYLVSHAVSSSHGLLRVRLRPKILLAETYEEAVTIIRKYRHNLLGVISDVRFPKDGKVHPAAGLKLAQKVREIIPDLPFLLQSEEEENAEKAQKINIPYLDKNSQNLVLELRSYILQNYGFGSFTFKYPDGTVIAEARDITELERIIRILPDESLYYHGSNNHFSTWFRARTEFEIADELRSMAAAQFASISEIRAFILEVLQAFFQRYQSGVLDFEGLSKKDMENAFIKLGNGSLGGKARGIAFFKSLLAESDLAEKYEDMKVKTPRSFVVCSEVFEEFMEHNNLYDATIYGGKETEIAQKFLTAKLPAAIADNLRILIQHIRSPLAVRSSSILEDSRVQPFAGIYKTYIVPNNHADPAVRFQQLSDAVKLVYASVFYSSPVHYAKNVDIRIEEEKMAVLIQELVGEYYGDLYYPVISGVAQSYNFYPYSHMEAEEGTVSLALGFGKAIVDGDQVYRFSPAHPRITPPFAGPRDFFVKTQTGFYALNLEKSSDIQLGTDDNCTYEKHSLSRAEQDNTLEFVGSTYSRDDDCIYDNAFSSGPKLVTFAPILKYERLPLTEIIQELLTLGKQSFGTDVEIEFAVNIPKDKTKPKEFYFLQARPMVVGREAVQVKLDDEREVLCSSHHTVGNGVFENIRDIIFVDPELFELKDTIQIASEIGELNERLFQEDRKCILIGFGRLGTSDRWLGIPLEWSQMSQARVVVEVDRADLKPEPSLGSHFFHNLTSMNMGYFHIQHNNSAERVDWGWLNSLPVLQETKYVKLVRSEEPLLVKIDGRSFKGNIYR